MPYIREENDGRSRRLRTRNPPLVVAPVRFADLLRHSTICSLLCLLLVSDSFWSTTCSDGTPSLYPNAFACAIEMVEKEGQDDLSRIRRGGRGDVKNRTAIFPPAAADEVSGKALTLNEILYKAGKRSLGGGLSGAVAGAIQVVSLMWLRTIINYQCRYGTTFSQAFATLLREGGISRLYRGVSFALVQAPLARFASTAANDGIESLLANLAWTKDWGPGRTTVIASIVVGIWRIVLMRK